MSHKVTLARTARLWHSRGVAREDVVEVTVGPRGRIVVPASLRRRLGVEPGTVLLLRLEGDRIVLEPRRAALERARRRFDVVPASVSLVDELIAERRKQARREEARRAAK
jgi:AbrB family looped-hinge helix DNA binding protein